MRKSLSILLLPLLLFNMLGFSIYSLLKPGCPNESVRLSTDNSELLLKIPFTIPYATQWEGQEQRDLELLHRSDFYHIISRKLEKDTLYVRCEFKESARDRFWALISEFDGYIDSSKSTGSTQPGNMMKHFLKEYMCPERRLTFYILEWLSPQLYPDLVQNDLSCVLSAFFTPPDLKLLTFKKALNQPLN